MIAALPTRNAVASIERVVECFPDHRQHQIRSQLSDVLAGVISQQLLPRLDGGGRVAAFEVLLANQEIKSLIKEQKYFQIPSVMRSCRKEGMVSMDDAVYDLYMKSMIDSDTAVCYAQDGGGHASESTVILNYYRNLKCFLKDNRCVDAISFEA